MHVGQGGGSFGRHLFHDAAAEAAEASQKMGKPVKLMWSRTDDFRQGRAHPMCVSRVRATYLLGNVVSFEQRHTSVQTEFSHGLGEMITSYAAQLPDRRQPQLRRVDLPADPVLAVQLRRHDPAAQRDPAEVQHRQHAQHLLAQRGHRPGARRRPAGRRSWARTRSRSAASSCKDDRLRAVLDKAVQVGNWGRALPAGRGAGHRAALGVPAARSRCLVEIDCRPETVNRRSATASPGRG